MSLLRSGKAIKNEVFEKPQNPLIIFEGSDVEYFTKIEDKISILNKPLKVKDTVVHLVWTGATRSDVFKLDQEDIQRLLDNQNKDV